MKRKVRVNWINNEYYFKMFTIIKASRKNKYIKGTTCLHHIVPRMWYRDHKIKIDNSKNNLVYLSAYDHAMVHYYMIECIENKYRGKACLAFCLTVKAKNCIKVSEDEARNLALLYSSKYNEICEACGKSGKKGGHHHTYIESEEHKKLRIKGSLQSHQNKIDEQRKKGWFRASELAIKYSTTQRTIYNRIRFYKIENIKIGGNRYSRDDELLGVVPPENYKGKRKCECVETGDVFNSISEASRKYKLNKSNIGVACREPNRVCGGYHWKYIDE